jgi:DNA polymerase-3 subunit gamma/tau
MEKYVVSARKYRPDLFEKVLGQEHVTKTLRNSILQNKLAHAFLFCGPRGVGKTTCARILAKAINCEDPDEHCEPCGKCTSCDSFQKGGSMNIYELDAASNNHVDDIRRLIEQVRYAPQSGKYKTYIIDEVHMLSQAAFNAFLKTLEEPPSYAIFILATTEKHKIIPTILSRCQIFDFYRIDVAKIVEQLSMIADTEKVKYDKEALHLIAQKSDGGLRDALSVFDRVLSFSGKEITYQSVIENLNILDYDYYFKFLEAVMVQDHSIVLSLLDEILGKGFEGDEFVHGISEHIRQLLVCKHPNTIQLLDASESLKQRYQQQSDLLSTSFLISALDILNQCDINYKQAHNHRLHVEINLLKLCFVQSKIENKAPIHENVSDVKKKTKQVPEITKPSPVSEKEKITEESKVPETVKENGALMPDEQKEGITSEVKEEPVKTNDLPKKMAPSVPSFKLSEIVAIDNTKEEEEEEAEIMVDEDVILDQKDLNEAWKAFIAEQEKEDSSGYSLSLLRKLKPEVFQHNIFKVIVGHKVEKERLIEKKREAMLFLRKKMGVPNLSMDIEVDEVRSNKEAIPYTNRDKFKKMLEKNPKLLDLKDHLDLEIDY